MKFNIQSVCPTLDPKDFKALQRYVIQTVKRSPRVLESGVMRIKYRGSDVIIVRR